MRQVPIYHLVFILICLSSCGPVEDDFDPRRTHMNRVAELSPDQRRGLIPNDLFASVWNNDLYSARSIMDQDPGQIHSQNIDGDTPLGVALYLDHRELIDLLLERSTAEDLQHANKKGESYIFLVSRTGNVRALRKIADEYHRSLSLMNDYEFGDLDFPNQEGETALFVARDRTVIEVLYQEYYRGFLELPFDGFLLHRDHRDRTFLHRAAAEGRVDVIAWANEAICIPSSWENSERIWQALPGRAVTYLWRSFQTYLWDIDTPKSLLFNRQDVDGQTPLHLALHQRQFAAARALSGCRWLDYDVPDKFGRLPIHNFLMSLNPLVARHTEEDHTIFKFLMGQNTKLRKFYRSVFDRVREQDSDGDTPLHLAARIVDPFFYDELMPYGDPLIRNQQGLSALELRKQLNERSN